MQWTFSLRANKKKSEMFSQEPLFEVAVEKLKGMMGVLDEVLEKMKEGSARVDHQDLCCSQVK